MAIHPSFAMNGVFVGGSANHGAFWWGRRGANPPSRGGGFYVGDVSRVRHTSSLMVFCSARGHDIDTSHNGALRRGHWIVTPPRPHPTGSYGQIAGGWDDSNNFHQGAHAPTWGHVDARYFQKAVTVMFDGHVRMQSLEDLRDMRTWSNFATSPDWDFEPAP